MGQERSKNGTSAWGPEAGDIDPGLAGEFATCCGVNLAGARIWGCGTDFPKVDRSSDGIRGDGFSGEGLVVSGLAGTGLVGTGLAVTGLAVMGLA